MLAMMWRKMNTPPLLVGLQTCTTTLEISLAVPQIIGHSTTDVHSSLVYNSQKPEAGKNPHAPQQKNGYIKCGTFTQWSTSQLLKNEFMKFLGKWMDLEGIILSEVTQSQRTCTICTH